VRSTGAARRPTRDHGSSYLLVDTPPWRPVAALLDEAWYLDPPAQTRLVARHVAYGKPPDAARAWSVGSDQRNAEVVADTRRPRGRGRAHRGDVSSRRVEWPPGRIRRLPGEAPLFHRATRRARERSHHVSGARDHGGRWTGVAPPHALTRRRETQPLRGWSRAASTSRRAPARAARPAMTARRPVHRGARPFRIRPARCGPLHRDAVQPAGLMCAPTTCHSPAAVVHVRV